MSKKQTGTPAPSVEPRKLDTETHQKVVEALRSGNYREIVAKFAGIGVSTLYRWFEEGEADAEYDRPSPQRELWEAATRAEAEAEIHAVASMRQAFGDDWRAAAEYLQRRHSARWSKTDRLEVEGDHTVHGAVSIEIVPTAEQEAEIARLLASPNGDGS